MTTTHQTRSPSKAYRYLACPGSIREEAAYPDPPSGPGAIDGTHSHTLLEHCIIRVAWAVRSRWSGSSSRTTRASS